jgi:hypothetical protein
MSSKAEKSAGQIFIEGQPAGLKQRMVVGTSNAGIAIAVGS